MEIKRMEFFNSTEDAGNLTWRNLKAVFMKPQSRLYIPKEDYARMLEAEEMKGMVEH